MGALLLLEAWRIRERESIKNAPLRMYKLEDFNIKLATLFTESPRVSEMYPIYPIPFIMHHMLAAAAVKQTILHSLDSKMWRALKIEQIMQRRSVKIGHVRT